MGGIALIIGSIVGLGAMGALAGNAARSAAAAKVDPRAIRLQQLLARRQVGPALTLPEMMEAANLATQMQMPETAAIMASDISAAMSGLITRGQPQQQLPKSEPWPTPQLPGGAQSPTKNVYDAVAAYVKSKLPVA